MNQLNFNDVALGMITTNSCLQFIRIEKCAEDVQRCHVKIREGSVHRTACKVEFLNDTTATKKHHAESNIVAEELPTLSFYTRQNDTMEDGDSLNHIQLPINNSSHNDVHLYKNVIFQSPQDEVVSFEYCTMKSLVAVFQAIDILVFQLEGQDYKTVAENYRLSEDQGFTRTFVLAYN